MKPLLSVLFLPFLFFTDTINLTDLKRLEGKWRGTLTYLDYQSGKPYSLPVAITASEDRKVPNGLVLFFAYPNEPKANGFDTLRILENGRFLNKQKVAGKEMNGKTMVLRTEREGEDDNRKATLFYTTTVSDTSLTMRMEVLYTGEEKRLLRNEFKLKKER